MMDRVRLVKRCLVLLALLAGCANQPAPPAAARAPDTSWYRQAAAAGKEVFVIDSAQSLIAVTVRRGGPLARLGHDHVVASRSVTGFAAPQDGRADFQFRLDQMTVDEAGLRREAGLDTVPSAAAIAGTRQNMLTRVLEADRFPLVLLHAERTAGAGAQAGDSLRLGITLHGVSRTVEVPATIARIDGSLVASGTLLLRQSDFGITPMSVMGGAMTVLDAMELRFRLVGRRVNAD